MKTLSATPRPYNFWKAETLSFLRVLLILGVNVTSLLTTTRQNYGIVLKASIFGKLQIHQ